MGRLISSFAGKLRSLSLFDLRLRNRQRKERRRLTCEFLEQRLPLAIGVAGWWKAESNVIDLIGGNNGSSGNPGYSAGMVGSAFHFGVGSSAVRIHPTNTNLDFGGDLTAEAWVYLSAANNNNGLVYRGDFVGSQGDFAFGFLSGVQNQLVFRVNSQNFSGNVNGNGQVVTQNANGTAFTLTTGTWHHVAAVYDAIDSAVDTMTIYVDGVARGSSTYNGDRVIRNASNPLILGAYRSSSYQLNGRLDEISIYDTALSQSDIQSIYNIGSAGKSSMLCLPGTYSATGLFPGTLASLGNYVSSAGATFQTVASIGHYVDTIGATGQTPSPLGRYVPTMGATSTTIAPPGTYVNTIAATVATPSQPGYYIPRAGATSSAFQIAAPVGRYAPAGSSTAILAPAGSYVGTIAASAPTLAQPGYFVPISGASSQTPAPVGAYVPNSGATAPTVASLGFFVPSTAATRQTPAPAGSYVPTTGASVCRLAAPGYFVATSGASSQTPAPVGAYVPNSGATVPTLASLGFYVPSIAATRQTPAPAGSYVPTTGATICRLASPGYYVPLTGASAQTAASPGYYVANSGATSQTLCPIGTISGHAATSCQSFQGSRFLSTDATGKDLFQQHGLTSSSNEVSVVYAGNDSGGDRGLAPYPIATVDSGTPQSANSNSMIEIANPIDVDGRKVPRHLVYQMFMGTHETKRTIRERHDQGIVRDLGD